MVFAMGPTYETSKPLKKLPASSMGPVQVSLWQGMDPHQIDHS